MSEMITERLRSLLGMAYEDGFSQAHQGFQPNQSARKKATGEAFRQLEEMSNALVWYEEQVRLCRKLGGIPDGEAARNALSKDGGERARKALAGATNG